MRDAGSMRGGQSVRYLHRDVYAFAKGKLASSQRVAFDKLTDEVIGAHIVDANYIRVVERRYGTSLLLKTVSAVWVRSETLREYLERHKSAKTRVASFVHLTHAARPE